MTKTLSRVLLALATVALLASSLGAQSQTTSKALSTTTCPGAGCVVLGTSGVGGLGVQVTGTFSGTLTFEGSIDGVTFSTLNLTPVNGTTATTTTTSTGVWSGGVGGLSTVRVRFSSYSSGTAVVTLQNAPTTARGGGSGSGGTPGGSTTEVQRNNAGAFGGITGATSDGTTMTLTTPTILTGATLTGGTATTAVSPLDITQTWNNSGVTFPGFRVNVTNTASASGSTIADFQLGGTSAVMIDRTGVVYGVPGVVSSAQPVYMGGLQARAGGAVGWKIGSGNSATNRPVFYVDRSDGQLIFGGDNSGVYVNGKVQLGTALTNGDTCMSRSSAGVVEFTNCTAATIRDTLTRHDFAGGTAPTVGNTSANSCGTTAATIAGKDEAGAVTVGATSGTSCTVTFGTAYSNAPSCWATNVTTPTVLPVVTSTTTAIISGTFAAGDVLRYGCRSF